jgi:hypothetical protein
VSRSWTTIVLWAAFLGVLAAVTAPFDPDIYTVTLLAGSALFTLAIGVLVLVANGPGDQVDRRRDGPPPGLSYPAMLLGVGLGTVGLGTQLGDWLVLVGAGLCVLALGGLIREWRAERRAAKEA